MEQIPLAVRILPMSSEEDDFVGKDSATVQRDFFLRELPRRRGKYYFHKSGLDAKPGTVVLFQFHGHVIAMAVLERIEYFSAPSGDSKGAINFHSASIRVFEPMDSNRMKEFWPKFHKFNQSKQTLDPNNIFCLSNN
jgi:hypothetical protein